MVSKETKIYSVLRQNSDNPNLTWQLFEQLVLSSPSPSLPCQQSLVLVSELVSSSPALHPQLSRLQSYLLSLPPSLSLPSLSSLLRSSLRRRRQFPLLTNDIYTHMLLRGLTPDTRTVNLLLHVLCESGHLDNARKLFDEMPIRGIPRNAHSVGVLVRGYCRNGLSSDAIELVSEETAANMVVFNTLVSGFCREGRVEEAESVVGRMREMGLSPNVVTFNARISGLCKHGGGRRRVLEASRILGDMETEEDLTKPNQITYNLMLDGFCKEGMLEEAQALLDSMKTRGFFGTLDSYNVWLGGLIRNGKLKEARELLEEMGSKGVEPSIYSYNIVIDGLCKDRATIPQAKLVLGLMKSKGVSPDTVTYTTLIHGYSTIGKNVGMANRMLDEMACAGCFPNTFTCNVLLRSLWREGRVSEAEKMLRMMKEKGYGKDIVSCNIVIDGLCKTGKLDKAIEIVKGMWIHGSAALGELGNAFLDLVDGANSGPKCVPDLITYSTLIDGLCKAGRFEEAKKLLLEMMVKNIAPDEVVYNTFISGYCKHGKVSSAFKVVRDMEKKGFKPDVITYNLLTWGLAKKHQIDEIQDLMKQMREKGVRPDIVTYNNLMYSLCEEGMVRRAGSVLNEMMMKNGFAPNITSYRLLIRAFCKAGEFDVAQTTFQAALTACGEKEALYRLMCNELCAYQKVSKAKGILQVAIEKGFCIDKFEYRYLVEELCKGDKVDDAHSLVLSMVDKGYQFDPATFMPVIDALVSMGNKRGADKLSEQMMSVAARQDKLFEGYEIGGLKQDGSLENDWRSLLHRDDGSGIALKVLKRVQKGWGQGDIPVRCAKNIDFLDD